MSDITTSYIKYKKIEYASGTIEINFNTISLQGNFSTMTMKDFNDLKKIFLKVLETNDSLILDLTRTTILNSSGISLLIILAKTCRLEYHKGLKIFFTSLYDWQTKMIVNIFKLSGPCDILDSEGKISGHSIINNYYSFI